MTVSDMFPFVLAICFILYFSPVLSFLRRLPHVSLPPYTSRLSISSPMSRHSLHVTPCDPDMPFTPLATRKFFRISHIGNRARSDSSGSGSSGRGDEDEEDGMVRRLVLGKVERGEEEMWRGRSALKGGRERYLASIFSEGGDLSVLVPSSSPPAPPCLEVPESDDSDLLYEDYDLSLTSSPLPSLPLYPNDNPLSRVRICEPLDSKASLAALRQTFTYTPSSLSILNHSRNQQVLDSNGGAGERKVYKRTPPSSRGDRRKWFQAQAREAQAAVGAARILRSRRLGHGNGQGQGLAGWEAMRPIQPLSRASSFNPDWSRSTLKSRSHVQPLVRNGAEVEKAEVEDESDEDRWEDAPDSSDEGSPFVSLPFTLPFSASPPPSFPVDPDIAALCRQHSPNGVSPVTGGPTTPDVLMDKLVQGVTKVPSPFFSRSDVPLGPRPRSSVATKELQLAVSGGPVRAASTMMRGGSRMSEGRLEVPQRKSSSKSIALTNPPVSLFRRSLAENLPKSKSNEDVDATNGTPLTIVSVIVDTSPSPFPPPGPMTRSRMAQSPQSNSTISPLSNSPPSGEKVVLPGKWSVLHLRHHQRKVEVTKVRSTRGFKS